MNNIFWQTRFSQNLTVAPQLRDGLQRFSSVKSLTVLLFVLLAMLVPHASAATEKENAAKIAKVGKPITNEQGDIRYIVLLDDGRSVDTEKPAPGTINKAEVESAVAQIKRATDELVADVMRPAGAKTLRNTALIAPTFLAYLDEKQVKQLSNDKRVIRLEQDTHLQTSNVWNNSNSGGQNNSWGVEAMGLSSPTPSNGVAVVYIVDTGMVPHFDLPQFGPYNEWRASQGVTQPPCWDHATHVAGIIGAANNGGGTVGMLPGVAIVSMNVDTGALAFNSSCSTGISLSNIVWALDAVRYSNLSNAAVSIVNISINTSDEPGVANAFRSVGVIGIAMQALATPGFITVGYVYIPGVGFVTQQIYTRGSLVVQSAGNYSKDACDFAYDRPYGFDGILVAGALDENGNKVRQTIATTPTMPGSNSFETIVMGGPYAVSSLSVLRQAGSNDGSCVDVWAPGQRINSLWRDNGTQVLSGTSMAAPHVVGLAARLLEANPIGLDTPAKLEQEVRQQMITIGGSSLPMARFGGSVNAAASIDIQAMYDNPSSNNPPRIWRRASHGASNFAGSMGANSSTPLNLTVGAVGAVNCDYNIYDANNSLVILSQGLGNLSSNKLFVATDFGLSTLPPPQTFRTLVVYCASPFGQITNATAKGIVLQ